MGDFQGVSPNATTIAEVQKALFEGVFADEMGFRKHDTPLRKSGKTALAFSSAATIETDLNENADRFSNLVSKSSRAEWFRDIALYHAGIMAIHPIEDLSSSFGLNRLLATTLTEGQIYHCFGDHIKHSIDGQKYIDALKKCINEGDMEPFQKLMGDVVNLLHFELPHEKGPDFEHEL